jgi:hypothetical protein
MEGVVGRIAALFFGGVEMARFVGVSSCVAFVLGSMLVGCGGGASPDAFGPDPDFATLDGRLSTPTGTLSTTTVDAAVSALDAVRAPELSIDALARVSPSNTTCDALGHRDATGTCACPAGGTFTYDFSEIADRARPPGSVATLRMKLDHCAIGDHVLDGKQFAERDGDTIRAFTAELTVTRAANAVDVVVWSTGSGEWARAAGSDGEIVVGATPKPSSDTPSESVIVKDRQTTWTCSVSDAGQRCSSANGQERDGKA